MGSSAIRKKRDARPPAILRQQGIQTVPRSTARAVDCLIRAAKKKIRGRDFLNQMAAHGIMVCPASLSSLAEAGKSTGIAYKNISEVVNTVDGAGISKEVAAFRPIGNIKG